MVTVSSYVPGPIGIVYGTVLEFSGTAFTAACTLVYSAPLLATVSVTPVAAAASPGRAVSRAAARAAAASAAVRPRVKLRERAGVTSMSATRHS